jgi:hypothetical protein
MQKVVWCRKKLSGIFGNSKKRPRCRGDVINFAFVFTSILGKNPVSDFVFVSRTTRKHSKCKSENSEQVSRVGIDFASCSMASNGRRRNQLMDDLSKRLRKSRKEIKTNTKTAFALISNNERRLIRRRRKAKPNDLDQNFISFFAQLLFA